MSHAFVKNPCVVIGIGQVGQVLAMGLLRQGYPVFPMNRGDDPAYFMEALSNPQLVLITVGKENLAAVLAALPESWRAHVALVQNELSPKDWQEAKITNPTLAALWFERRDNGAPRVILPTPLFGPKAGILAEALSAMRLPFRMVGSEDAMIVELALKYLFTLTTMFGGLKTGGSIGVLWNNYRALALAIAEEILSVGELRFGLPLPRQMLLERLTAVFDAAPALIMMRDNALARLEETIEFAQTNHLKVPTLRDIYDITSKNGAIHAKML
jgi:hypothetical protein